MNSRLLSSLALVLSLVLLPLPALAAGTVNFSVAEQTVSESDGLITVTLRRTSSGVGTATAEWVVGALGTTAMAGSDYQAAGGVVSWADGDMADKTFTITLVGDTKAEPQEKLLLNLSKTTGATVGWPKAHTIYINDAPASTGTLEFTSASQSDIEGTVATMTVRRAGGASGAVSVQWVVGPLGTTASAGTDYQGNSGGTLTWMDGEIADKNFSVMIPDDHSAELQEKVLFNLSNATGAKVGAQKSHTLFIDDAPAAVDVGGSAECAAAFAGIGAGMAMAEIDPAMPYGTVGRLVLSFASAAERTAAAQFLLSGNLLSDAQKRDLSGFRKLPMLVVPAATITSQGVEALRRDLTTYRLVSIWSGEHQIAPLLDESVALIGVPAARAAFGSASLPLTGKGVGVAVIDTGLDQTQGDFPDERIKANVRIVGDPIASSIVTVAGVPNLWTAVPAVGTSEWTSNGHGTHLAGTIVGDGAQSQGRYAGVAPGADLVAVAVEFGSYLYAVAGIDYVLSVKDQYNIRVTNHSYGPATGSGFSFNASDPESLARKALYDANIISVQSAGNGGSANDTIGPQAQNPCVISVASGRKDRTLSSFSSRGTPDGAKAPDITAPGEDITAARALNAIVAPSLGGNPLPDAENSSYIAMSGTSMAAPHVAASVAILLEAKPTLNFQAVMDVLQQTAQPMAGYQVHEVGAGYLDVLAALADERVLDRELNFDTDGDGILDTADNCPLVSNPGQEDADGDGLGDACDGSSGSACDVPGHTIAGDPANDDTPPLPTASSGQGDLLSLHVAEPDAQAGKLVFTLKLRSLETLPPNMSWYVIFDGLPKAGYALGKWHVEMQTDELSTPSFSYGRYNATSTGISEGPGAGDEPVATAVAGSSYDAARGTITLAVNAANFGAAGDELTNLQAEVYQLVGSSFVGGSLQTVDETSTGRYTLRAADACDVPAPDRDGDGLLNEVDNCPTVANADQANFDGDAGGDACDADDDNDGAADGSDAFPFDPAESVDTDGDGSGNNADDDDDGDGIADGSDECPLDPAPGCGGVTSSDARVVVAVLDTGINPYHEFYYDGPSEVTPAVLAEFGIDAAHSITLTRTGNFASDYAADLAAGKWNVARGELYWFVGTNIIAASFDTAAGRRRILPDPADAAAAGEHGVGTSSAVLKANPEAILLFVESGLNIGAADVEQFGFHHPAVDVVSTSYGIAIGGAVGTIPETAAFNETFDSVVAEGKLHFTSAGNNPGYVPVTGGGGPWWSIGVGGVEEDNYSVLTDEYNDEGQTILAGNFPDFVGDYTEQLPYCYECESGINDLVPGTSFSTPRAAGVASKVILEARRAVGHGGGIRAVGGKPVMVDGAGHSITNWMVRRALEQAAFVPATAVGSGNYVTELLNLPVNPVAPWLQVAWGELTPNPAKGVVGAALAELGLGGTVREKALGFCEFQTTVILQRKMYWDSLAPLIHPFNPIGTPNEGQSEPLDEDPFLYCESPVPGF